MQFDRRAAEYAESARFQRAIAAELVEGFSPAGLGLDLGSGTGFVGSYLQAQQWVEVDQSPAMLAQSRHAQRVVADARALPFARDAFDWLTSSLAMQWVGSAQDALRVLKPGAPLRVAIVLADSLPELANARQKAGLSTALELPDASHWSGQWPVEGHIRDHQVEFASPAEALASVRNIGAGGPAQPPISRVQLNELLAHLGTRLTYRILWISGVNA